MKPAKPMTMVVDAEVLPASAVGPKTTFGMVTVKLKTQAGGLRTPAIEIGPLALSLRAARELAKELVQASDQAEQSYGPGTDQ